MKDEDVSALRSRIRKHVSGLYAVMDAAHGLDHVDQVCDTALRLCKVIKRPQLMPEAIVASYFHDMFADRGMTHPQDAHDWVLEHPQVVKHLIDTTDKGVMRIAKACLEHDISYQGDYSSLLSEVIATADIGRPSNTIDRYRRAYLYARTTLNHSTDRAIDYAVHDVDRKYGPEGTVVYPRLYNKVFAKELQLEKALIVKINSDRTPVAKRWMGWEDEVAGKVRSS